MHGYHSFMKKWAWHLRTILLTLLIFTFSTAEEQTAHAFVEVELNVERATMNNFEPAVHAGVSVRFCFPFVGCSGWDEFNSATFRGHGDCDWLWVGPYISIPMRYCLRITSDGDPDYEVPGVDNGEGFTQADIDAGERPIAMCLHEDNPDPMDLDFGFMPFHHNTPNPANTSEGLRTGAIGAAVVGIIFPPALLLSAALGLASLITENVNLWSAGRGMISSQRCFVIPLAPYPPPFTDSLVLGMPTPRFDRICEDQRLDLRCVNDSSVRIGEECPNPDHPNPCVLPKKNGSGDRLTNNRFENPSARVSFRQVLKFCSEVSGGHDKPKEDCIPDSDNHTDTEAIVDGKTYNSAALSLLVYRYTRLDRSTIQRNPAKNIATRSIKGKDLTLSIASGVTTLADLVPHRVVYDVRASAHGTPELYPIGVDIGEYHDVTLSFTTATQNQDGTNVSYKQYATPQSVTVREPSFYWNTPPSYNYYCGSGGSIPAQCSGQPTTRNDVGEECCEIVATRGTPDTQTMRVFLNDPYSPKTPTALYGGDRIGLDGLKICAARHLPQRQNQQWRMLDCLDRALFPPLYKKGSAATPITLEDGSSVTLRNLRDVRIKRMIFENYIVQPEGGVATPTANVLDDLKNWSQARWYIEGVPGALVSSSGNDTYTNSERLPQKVSVGFPLDEGEAVPAGLIDPTMYSYTECGPLVGNAPPHVPCVRHSKPIIGIKLGTQSARIGTSTVNFETPSTSDHWVILGTNPSSEANRSIYQECQTIYGIRMCGAPQGPTDGSPLDIQYQRITVGSDVGLFYLSGAERMCIKGYAPSDTDQMYAKRVPTEQAGGTTCSASLDPKHTIGLYVPPSTTGAGTTFQTETVNFGTWEGTGTTTELTAYCKTTLLARECSHLSGAALTTCQTNVNNGCTVEVGGTACGTSDPAKVQERGLSPNEIGICTESPPPIMCRAQPLANPENHPTDGGRDYWEANDSVGPVQTDPHNRGLFPPYLHPDNTGNTPDNDLWETLSGAGFCDENAASAHSCTSVAAPAAGGGGGGTDVATILSNAQTQWEGYLQTYTTAATTPRSEFDSLFTTVWTTTIGAGQVDAATFSGLSSNFTATQTTLDALLPTPFTLTRATVNTHVTTPNCPTTVTPPAGAPAVPADTTAGNLEYFFACMIENVVSQIGVDSSSGSQAAPTPPSGTRLGCTAPASLECPRMPSGKCVPGCKLVTTGPGHSATSVQTCIPCGSDGNGGDLTSDECKRYVFQSTREAGSPLRLNDRACRSPCNMYCFYDPSNGGCSVGCQVATDPDTGVTACFPTCSSGLSGAAAETACVAAMHNYCPRTLARCRRGWTVNGGTRTDQYFAGPVCKHLQFEQAGQTVDYAEWRFNLATSKHCVPVECDNFDPDSASWLTSLFGDWSCSDVNGPGRRFRAYETGTSSCTKKVFGITVDSESRSFCCKPDSGWKSGTCPP